MNIDTGTAQQTAARKKGSGKLLIILAILAAILVLARMSNAGSHISGFRSWIESMGTAGMIVYVVVYVIITVAAAPASAISIAGGAIFGAFKGVVLVSIASTAGATISFLISRYFARNTIMKFLSKKRNFIRLDKLSEKHGALIVAVTRLLPIFPFALLNYGFGLTRVSLKDYVFWSWLGMLPGTILYVAGADAVTKTVEEGGIPWGLVLVVVLMIGIITLLVRQARKKIAGDTDNTLN